MSSDESGLLNDESNDDGSDSGSSGTYYFCAFLCVLMNSVARVSGFGSGVFSPTGVNSKCDSLRLLCSYQ